MAECDYLDRRLKELRVNFTDYNNPLYIMVCEECPYPDCIVPSDDRDLKERKLKEYPPREKVLQCPSCHTQETMIFRGGIMDGTRMFLQVGDEVYHNCNQTKCIIIKVRSD